MATIIEKQSPQAIEAMEQALITGYLVLKCCVLPMTLTVSQPVDLHGSAQAYTILNEGNVRDFETERVKALGWKTLWRWWPPKAKKCKQQTPA